MDKTIQEKLMRIAMAEAEKAIQAGNSPFGALLVAPDGSVIERAYNTEWTDNDPTAHAEMNLIRKAVRMLGTTDLSPYYLVCNAQSCSMCFSAAIKCNIQNYVFGADSEGHMNPNLTVYDLAKYAQTELVIHSGVLKEQCRRQIKEARESTDRQFT